MPEDKKIIGDPTGLVEQFSKLAGIMKFEAEAIKNGFRDIEGGALALNKQFGQSRQRIHELKLSVAEAAPEVYRLGGTLEDAVKTAMSVSEATRRNVLATKEDISDLYAAEQVLGDGSGRMVSTLVENFQDIGFQFSQVGQQLKDTIGYIQSVGVNTGQVMSRVMENMSQMNRFNFQDGVMGLTKMATQATLLKFDMGQVFSFANQALKPEKAIEFASAFQRLGLAAGGLTDPFELMYKSLNDPEGIQKSLVEMSKQFTYFDEKTKSFKISPAGMLQLRELESETQISAAEMSKLALNTADLDRKLSMLKPDLTFASEEDKMYLANIAKLDKEGNYKVEFVDERGQQVSTNLRDISQKQLDELIAQEKDRPKDLQDIARKQLTTFQVMQGDLLAIRNKVVGGIVTSPKVSFLAEDLGSIGKIVTDTLNKSFSSKDVRDKVDSTIGDVKDILVKMAKGESTKFDFQELKKATEGVFDFEKLKDKIKDLGEKISDKIPSKIKERYNLPDFQSLLEAIQNMSSEYQHMSDLDRQYYFQEDYIKGRQGNNKQYPSQEDTKFKQPKLSVNTQTTLINDKSLSQLMKNNTKENEKPQLQGYKLPNEQDLTLNNINTGNINLSSTSLTKLLAESNTKPEQPQIKIGEFSGKQDLSLNTINADNINLSNTNLTQVLSKVFDKSEETMVKSTLKSEQPLIKVGELSNKQDLAFNNINAENINLSNTNLTQVLADMSKKPEQQVLPGNNLPNRQDLAFNNINAENINLSNTSLTQVLADISKKPEQQVLPGNNLPNKQDLSQNKINVESVPQNKVLPDGIQTNNNITGNLSKISTNTDTQTGEKSLTHKHIFEGTITWKIDAPPDLDKKSFYAMIDKQEFRDAFTKIVVEKFKETENSPINNMG